MKILQRSNSQYSTLVEFDLGSSSWNYFKSENAASGDDIEIGGKFEILSETFLGYFCFENRLYLQVNSFRFDAENVHIDYRQNQKSERVLKIKDDGDTIFEIKYRVELPDEDFFHYTAFSEEEDFDFGLQVSNVFNNTSRKNVLLNSD